MDAAAVSMTMIGLFITLLFFVIGIIIMRWAFRINDIIKRLDQIVQLLQSGQR